MCEHFWRPKISSATNKMREWKSGFRKHDLWNSGIRRNKLDQALRDVYRLPYFELCQGIKTLLSGGRVP